MHRVESNPEIRAVLEAVQKQLREAVASGRKGLVHLEPVSFADSHLWQWEEPAIRYRLDLNKLTRAGAKC